MVKLSHLILLNDHKRKAGKGGVGGGGATSRAVSELKKLPSLHKNGSIVELKLKSICFLFTLIQYI